jgi:hypothetical protein
VKRVLVLLFAAGAAFPQSDAPAQPARDLAAERDQVARLMNQGQCLAALPLAEDLVAANPEDAAVQGWLAYCLFAQSRTSATPEEAQALRKRARELAVRARELGSKWNLWTISSWSSTLPEPPNNRIHGGGGLGVGQDGLDGADRLRSEQRGLFPPGSILLAPGFDESLAKNGRAKPIAHSVAVDADGSSGGAGGGTSGHQGENALLGLGQAGIGHDRASLNSRGAREQSREAG